MGDRCHYEVVIRNEDVQKVLGINRDFKVQEKGKTGPCFLFCMGEEIPDTATLLYNDTMNHGGDDFEEAAEEAGIPFVALYSEGAAYPGGASAWAGDALTSWKNVERAEVDGTEIALLCSEEAKEAFVQEWDTFESKLGWPLPVEFME